MYRRRDESSSFSYCLATWSSIFSAKSMAKPPHCGLLSTETGKAGSYDETSTYAMDSSPPRETVMLYCTSRRKGVQAGRRRRGRSTKLHGRSGNQPREVSDAKRSLTSMVAAIAAAASPAASTRARAILQADARSVSRLLWLENRHLVFGSPVDHHSHYQWGLKASKPPVAWQANAECKRNGSQPQNRWCVGCCAVGPAHTQTHSRQLISTC